MTEPDANRAAISRALEQSTGLDDARIGLIVRAFYERARQDPAIGAKFAGVTDWEAHFARITDFWSSVMLGTGRYNGRPLPLHMPLGLDTADFARWLTLFEESARDHASDATVALLMEKARRIGSSMNMALQVTRGELPPRA